MPKPQKIVSYRCSNCGNRKQYLNLQKIKVCTRCGTNMIREVHRI